MSGFKALTKYAGLMGLFLALASVDGAPRVGSIASFKGVVKLKRAGTSETTVVKRRRTPLFDRDEVITGKNGSARILFTDGSRVDLSPGSKVTITAKGRRREITVSSGAIKSDIKKLPGSRTYFRTPAGIAAVKGTLVQCTVKGQNKVEISADLGLLTHQVPEMSTSADISRGKRLEIGLDKKQNSFEAKSLQGRINIKTKELSTTLNKQTAITTQLDTRADKICLGVKQGEAKTSTERGTTMVLDQEDLIDCVRTSTGMAVTVVRGQITIIDSAGARTIVKAGETAVELPGAWLEPETPEGHEVMIPPQQ